MANFCHIAPTAYLDLTQYYKSHLLLAHLVETDDKYVDFYNNVAMNGSLKILDNSAFEMYKQGRPMYPSEQLVEMGKRVKADYIVMSDYPNEHSQVTIDAAIKLHREFKGEGFGTFFCPQSKINDFEDLVHAFKWASENPEIVDYIGVSILAIPNAYGVEKGNKLQRFVSRCMFMHTLKQEGILDRIKENGQKVHMLGMVDGPNEIVLMHPFKGYIDTWDSSAAIWAGLNNITFDNSPTGMVNGKYEKEVDFHLDNVENSGHVLKATLNMAYIDNLVRKYI